MNKVIYDTSEMNRRMRVRGLSPRSLSAKKIGVSHPTIARILNTGIGHPEKVYRLAKALGLPVKPNQLSAILPKERKTA